mmetsp:Transcript_8776/g.14891  ORF Transcript_8776/g.14891 Transcript_8776/m.14891 type:complete len:378 (-) Transcript_8776:1106-2239(-)
MKAFIWLLLVVPSILSASSFSFSPQPASKKIATTATDLNKIPVVICPGFGNDAIDYLNPLDQGEEYGFVNALIKRGFNPDLITVLPLKRYEWIRVAGGLFDIPNFYTMTCTPEGLGYGWYIKRLRRTIEEVHQKSGGERCLLVGHSAGGWLARACLGDGSWNVEQLNSNDVEISEDNTTRAADRVRALITMGAVHKQPEKEFEATCVTRGALKYLNSEYPGAFLANEGISYVSVGGDAIVGKEKQQQKAVADDDVEKIGSEQVNTVYKDRGEGSASSVAYTSYAAVSGIGELTGDGVVPLEWTLLEGSKTIVLDGVLHSINEAGTTLPTDKWYGADAQVDRWLPEALKEAGIRVDGNKNDKQSNIFDSIQKMLSFED